MQRRIRDSDSHATICMKATVSALLLISGIAAQGQKPSLVESFSTATFASNRDPRFILSPQGACRQKRNKYAEFSKVDHQKADPLDELIAESKRKNEQLEKEKQLQQQKVKETHSVGPTSPIVFSANPKTIDPYDPSSFGYIQLANIHSAHGVQGWVAVKATVDFVDRRLSQCFLSTPGVRHLKPANRRAPRMVTMLKGKCHRSGVNHDDYLVKIKGVVDRDAAKLLQGAVLYIREEQATEIQEKLENTNGVSPLGRYEVSDLVGLDVLLDISSGNDSIAPFVGTIGSVVFGEDIASMPGGVGYDFLEVVLPRGGAFGIPSYRDELVLVPLVPQIVTQVDLGEGLVTINPPDGLLDLTYVRHHRTRVRGFLPPKEHSVAPPRTPVILAV